MLHPTEPHLVGRYLPNFMSRNARYHGKGSDIPGYNSTGRYHSAFADGHPGEDQGLTTDIGATFDYDTLPSPRLQQCCM